jgi:hypothetical protein
MFGFKRRQSKTGSATTATDRWSLDKRLISWSRNDHHTVRDSVNGIAITGISGSGKTSGPSAAFAKAHLRAGFGGVFHAVKSDDAALALEWCRHTGRLDDVILFGPKHPCRFNFLDYEYSRTGDGAGLTDNLVDHLLNVSEIRDRKSGGGGGGGGGENGAFFAAAKKQLLRVSIDVVTRAKGKISVNDIHKTVTSGPTSVEQFNSPQWREDSFCFACMAEAVRRGRGGSADKFKEDLELAGSYWCTEFPQLGDRTRSSVVSSVTGTIDTLNRGYLRQLLCDSTNFTPDMLADGKILIHDMSAMEYGEVGTMVQVVLKYAIQKAIERRDVSKSPRPVFFHLDEFQTLITSADSRFASTCRSARASMVLLTQTLPTVYGALGGGDQAKQEVNSLLANMNLKLFCANSDPETCEFASKLVGKVRTFTVNASRQRSNDYSGPSPGQTTAGVTEQIDFDLQPAALTCLRTGGRDNRFIVDAILHRTGTPFRSTGRNWMRTTFSQR